MNQRSNTDVRGREYVGNYLDAFLSPRKHTLEARIKIDGTICITLHYLDAKNNQTQHSIMLTNEQRKNLGEFLSKDEPILWKDLKVAKEA